MDIDFSIAGDFSELDYLRINSTLEALLNNEFQKENLIVFDVFFREKPKSKMVPEWKGYNIEFKITEKEKWYTDNLEKTRREALKIIGQSTKFSIDISSFEYITSAKKHDLDGTVLLVYTPEMIVIEKIRALCQSIPEYQKIIPTARVKGRARDFYDIWNICNQYPIDITSESNKILMAEIFAAKRVPIEFLELLPQYKDLQKENWQSVEDTLSSKYEDFDFYFDFVMQMINEIKTP